MFMLGEVDADVKTAPAGIIFHLASGPQKA
jgi:hypothetical protein